MSNIQTALLIVHTLIALAIIALVLLQRGKGAEAGAAFGAGASGTVFGGVSSGGFDSSSGTELETPTVGGLAVVTQPADKNAATSEIFSECGRGRLVATISQSLR